MPCRQPTVSETESLNSIIPIDQKKAFDSCASKAKAVSMPLYSTSPCGCFDLDVCILNQLTIPALYRSADLLFIPSDPNQNNGPYHQCWNKQQKERRPEDQIVQKVDQGKSRSALAKYLFPLKKGSANIPICERIMIPQLK